MAPQKQYTLADFLKFAHGNLPSNLADVQLYTFEQRMIVDEKDRAHEVTLLHLGRYFFRENGPQAWAQALTTGITYYSGQSGRVCKPIPQQHQVKIYYDYPVDRLFNMEGRNTYYRTDRYEPTLAIRDSVIETVIVFAFLYTGRLYLIDTFKSAAMLNNFKIACANFHKNAVKLKTESPIGELSYTSAAPSLEPEARIGPQEMARKTRLNMEDEMDLAPGSAIRPPRAGRDMSTPDPSPRHM
jgi:hypothetical protein